MVLDFFESKAKILEALFTKNTQTINYNTSAMTSTPMGYYSMHGM